MCYELFANLIKVTIRLSY